MRVLITGGRSDIGLAILRRRLKQGDTIMTTASSEPTLEDLRKTLGGEKSVSVCQWRMDEPRAFAPELTKFIDEGADALILNAAPPSRLLGRLHEMDEAEIEAMLRAQIEGNIFLLKACLGGMTKRQFGRILFISSQSVRGTSRYCVYAAGKGAVEAALRGVSTDYAEFNIRANSLRLGVIATQRNKRFWSRSNFAAVFSQLIPTRQLGTPEQVAIATDPFLAEDCYITGTELEVSGGLPSFRSEILLQK